MPKGLELYGEEGKIEEAPKPEYMIFESKTDCEKWLSATDKELGYPEDLSKFVRCGTGVFGPIELGRGMHYAEPQADQTGKKWMVAAKLKEKLSDVKDFSKSVTVVDTLPVDWHADMGVGDKL